MIDSGDSETIRADGTVGRPATVGNHCLLLVELQVLWAGAGANGEANQSRNFTLWAMGSH